MGLRRKVSLMLLSLVLVLFVGGGLLLYKGNDAVALGIEKKGGILTAEQLKLSFDTVGGRIIREEIGRASCRERV